MVKSSYDQPQSLKIGDKTILIPANTLLIPSYSAMHTHPRYWGLELTQVGTVPMDYAHSDGTKTKAHGGDHVPLASESFLGPSKYASPFIIWSAGARVCPGRKFSQVEFVAVITTLFHTWRVKPMLQAGEDEATARSRLQQVVEKETGMVSLLQLLHPEKAVLTWERR